MHDYLDTVMVQVVLMTVSFNIITNNVCVCMRVGVCVCVCVSCISSISTLNNVSL